MITAINKRKQLSVIHSFPNWLPQTQTWMFNQVHQLQQLGVEAHVVCERTENLDQFKVDNIHSLETQPFYISFWDRFMKRLKCRRHINYLVSIGRKYKPHVIHSHFGNIGWENIGAIRKLNARHIVTFYGQDVNKLPQQQPCWRRRYIKLFNEVDQIFCEGTFMASTIETLGCPSHKISVQHLGIDIPSIPFKPRIWKQGEALRVLIAASFREKKGIPYALEGLKILSNSIDIHITIIGDANMDKKSQKEKTRILDTIRKCKLESSTHLLGFQPHAVMLKHAYNNHIFLQPSITASDGDTEGGAPVTIIEMMATGMPLVASRHCDIPEVMGPNLTDCIVPEKNPTAIAECLKKLIQNPSKWPMLCKSARNHVEKEYDLKKQTYRQINKYYQLVT